MNPNNPSIVSREKNLHQYQKKTNLLSDPPTIRKNMMRYLGPVQPSSQPFLPTIQRLQMKKKEQLRPFLSEVGKKKLLKDYSYQEGTDIAETKAVRTTNYAKFDSVTGNATVMSFMLYQTIYPDQPVMNAQTIVQLSLTKNEEDIWQIDQAEMRLLNQPMPESFFS